MDLSSDKSEKDIFSDLLKTPLREGAIVGMGNSLLDLIGYVDKDILEKYDLRTNHVCLATDTHSPLFEELKTKFNAKYIVGGSAQNTLRVAQRIVGVPKASIIFGGIGSDEEGAILTNQARADGVDTQYQYIKEVPTGVCAVLLTKGGSERTLVSNLSASQCFTVDHLLLPDNKCRLERASAFYITGFFLPVSPESVKLAASMASSRDAWFTMNLSGVYVAQNCMHLWNEFMPYVDILFGNNDNAEDLLKNLQSEQSLWQSAHAWLKKTREASQEHSSYKIWPSEDQFWARTTLIFGKRGYKLDGIVTKFPVIELPPEKVVDTTGAGDAFVGGFLGQMVRGASWQECVRCGIWCASQVVQRQGCFLDDLAQYETAVCS